MVIGHLFHLLPAHSIDNIESACTLHRQGVGHNRGSDHRHQSDYDREERYHLSINFQLNQKVSPNHFSLVCLFIRCHYSVSV